MKGTYTALAAVVLIASLVSEGSAQMKDAKLSALAAEGKHIVAFGGCNHCHSQKVMTPQGPVVDEKNILAGAPAGATVAPVPEGFAPDKWGIATTMDLTTWAGPWGVSFAKNLTPDKETGLGSWTEAMFIKAMRTGKDMGEGRPILPPMPVQDIGLWSDHELKAIFAYLKTLKPVKNAVHDPIPPAGAPAGGH